LKAFEEKVRAQIGRSNPVLAGQLLAAAETIINALQAQQPHSQSPESLSIEKS
jgi:hypothetical protein